MANQKKIDKVAKKSARTYIKGIEEIISSLMKSKQDMTNEEFGAAMLSLDMKGLVQEKMKQIKTDYVNAHIEILKDKRPIGKIKKND
jgi:hypothetical protein